MIPESDSREWVQTKIGVHTLRIQPENETKVLTTQAFTFREVVLFIGFVSYFKSIVGEEKYYNVLLKGIMMYFFLTKNTMSTDLH